MPYRGIITGSYWEEWQMWNWQEFVEPKILFVGIVMYYGPEESHHYRFGIRFFHGSDTSLFAEYFRGIQTPHYLFGFCRFLDGQTYTTLERFTGEMHGLVMQWPGYKNIYDIVSLRVQGTGLYFNSERLFFHQPIVDRLRHGHYIELTEFNGLRTPLYLSGTGSFYFYYH